MKYKAIIFDLDGTIIDTNPIWKQANEQLLIQHGKKRSWFNLSKMQVKKCELASMLLDSSYFSFTISIFNLIW